MKWGLKRQKSISSHAESISAWKTVLRLAEHGGGVGLVPERARQQLGGPQEDRGAVVPRHAGPALVRLASRRDGLLDLGLARLVIPGEHVAVVVRHDAGAELAGAHLFPADDEGDLDLPPAHLGELGLERALLR